MDYISTRGGRPVSAAQAIVSGLAPDGGLYVPQSLPSFSLDEIASLAKLGYTGRAVEVLSRFLTDFTRGELTEYVGRAYAKASFCPRLSRLSYRSAATARISLSCFTGRPAPLRISRSSFCRFC